MRKTDGTGLDPDHRAHFFRKGDLNVHYLRNIK